MAPTALRTAYYLQLCLLSFFPISADREGDPPDKVPKRRKKATVRADVRQSDVVLSFASFGANTSQKNLVLHDIFRNGL